MILNFETEAIEVEENDLGILFIGFYTEENYLMIQQNLEVENSEYYLERDDQSYSGYGGVKQITLQPDSIEVELDETGQENLQCDGVKVDFQTDDETYELLQEKLSFIFGNLLLKK